MALTLALGGASASPAQTSPSGVNISTGSGAGTSPGVSPGSSPSSTRIGSGSLSSPNDPFPLAAPGPGGGVRPGSGPGAAGNVDPYGASMTGLSGGMNRAAIPTLTPAEMDALDAHLLGDARKILNPPDRALALERVAKAKTFSHRPGDGRLRDAEVALKEAAEAALAVTDLSLRDQRLMAIVRSELTLADEMARDGLNNDTFIDASDTRAAKPMTPDQRLDSLKLAEAQRKKAADVSRMIPNPNLRAEMLFRVADAEAQASQTMAVEALQTDVKRSDLRGLEGMLNRMADRSLIFAANDAQSIRTAIWRDRGMVSVAAAAAASEQYSRGIALCRTIVSPGYRADAMIRLAESQARHHLVNDATTTYDDAAQAVASIDEPDLREIIAGVLIDSLISVGRFDDARMSVVLMASPTSRLEVLGTVAESQGERRLADSARAWIDSDAPPEWRDTLRRRVNDGLLKAFEKGRSSPNNGLGALDLGAPAAPATPPAR